MILDPEGTFSGRLERIILRNLCRQQIVMEAKSIVSADEDGESEHDTTMATMERIQEMVSEVYRNRQGLETEVREKFGALEECGKRNAGELATLIEKVNSLQHVGVEVSDNDK